MFFDETTEEFYDEEKQEINKKRGGMMKNKSMYIALTIFLMWCILPVFAIEPNRIYYHDNKTAYWQEALSYVPPEFLDGLYELRFSDVNCHTIVNQKRETFLGIYFLNSKSIQICKYGDEYTLLHELCHYWQRRVLGAKEMYRLFYALDIHNKAYWNCTDNLIETYEENKIKERK